MLKGLKLAILAGGVFFSVSQSSACDALLKAFPRDCAIQDKFDALREKYRRMGVNIEEIAEYRVVRFIDRGSWEKAKKEEKGPRWIYEKSPDTWDVWDAGIRTVEANFDITKLDKTELSRVHAAVFNQTIAEKNTDQSLQPGQYRGDNNKSNNVFQMINPCAAGDTKCEQNPARVSRLKHINEMPLDNQKLQANWEQKSGVKFSEIVAAAGGANPTAAVPYSNFRVFAPANKVAYVADDKVAENVEWLLIFLRHNLDAYNRGQAAQAPIEFAADVQKWVVTIHPFANGNGRLSRAVQDLILKHFRLPKAPAGDLQNDVLSFHEEYRAETYSQIEKTLNRLANCTKYWEKPNKYENWKMACSTVSQLSELRGPAPAPALQMN